MTREFVGRTRLSEPTVVAVTDSAVPPRGPALERYSFLLSFDVDCGEQVQGHRLIARGLSDDGILSQDVQREGEDDWVRVEAPGVSLHYELVPGVPERAGRSVFSYLVGISYSADGALPWEPSDGGVIAPAEGGPSTHGVRGGWPLPAEARVLSFEMHPVLPGTTWPSESSAGRLVVDLETAGAEWVEEPS